MRVRRRLFPAEETKLPGRRNTERDEALAGAARQVQVSERGAVSDDVEPGTLRYGGKNSPTMVDVEHRGRPFETSGKQKAVRFVDGDASRRGATVRPLGDD